MRYSIITPTIVRSTLAQCCITINSQLEKDWEHIVIVDGIEADLSDEKRQRLEAIIHPQRKVYFCDRQHGVCGNICRHNAWEFASGEYVYYLDDDDYLYNSTSLGRLNGVTKPWAVFPVIRFGSRFFNIPPGILVSTTCGMLLRRDIARWPDILEYESDGHFIEELKTKGYEYEAVDGESIAVMTASNRGKYI